MLFKRDYKVYRTLEELPLWNWNKIQVTGDLRYLVEGKVRKKEKLEDIWEQINDEYIRDFGVNENYAKSLEIRKTIALHKIAFYTEGKKVARTYWKIEEEKLKDLETEESVKFEQNIIAIENYRKIPIDLKTTSTRKYFELIEYINGKASTK